MKPELANLFTINSTGQQGDFILSFFYEWQNTEDGKATDLKKQKVASVVLNINDFIQFTETISKIKIQLDEAKLKESGETP